MWKLWLCFLSLEPGGGDWLLKPGGPGLSDSALGGEGRVAGGWKELISAGGVERLAGVAPEIRPLLGGSESRGRQT